MFFCKDTVSDGIELSVIECNKFKAGVISFSLTLPLSKKAVAHGLILSGLLRRGTLEYPSMAALNRRLDELYGSYIEVKSVHLGSNMSLVLTAEVLDNKYIPDGTDALGGVIDIIADILLRPFLCENGFDKKLLDQEIRVTLDNLNAEINNTRVYSVRRCSELMRGDSSSYPTVSELKELVAATTYEDVIALRNEMLSSSPLEVFYIGDTPRAAIADKLRSAFATYSFSIEHTLNSVSPLRRERFVEAREKMPVSQSKLAMGFSSGVCISENDDTYYTALMLNEIFGGSASSKLFLNVRERMSLCYYCASSFSIYTGVMTVSSGIEADKLDIVNGAILEQLEEIKQGNISESEFSAARKSILHGYRQLYDSPFDLQSFYSGRMALGISDTVETCTDKLMRVTKDDVVALAKEISLDALFFIEGDSVSGADEEDENE